MVIQIKEGKFLVQFDFSCQTNMAISAKLNLK